jgi:hypothetical protein
MPLALVVVIAALAVTAVVGVLAYLIDKNEERLEGNDDH